MTGLTDRAIADSRNPLDRSVKIVLLSGKDTLQLSNQGKQMKSGIMVSAIIVLSMLTPAAGRSQMKARVAWTSFASNMSGAWVAQEEGLFRKSGLEVELVHIPSTSRAIQVLLAGELQYTYMDGRTAVQATLKGADAVIVTGVANRLVFSFMARPEIKTFNNLKGKKLASRGLARRPTA
jgi:ABC-type nitrate/sulfonate/bicarbonate transport system substrate-binding protein